MSGPRLAIGRDLRTDALTRPTEAMWAAMRACEPGWATFGEDPTVRALEERAAALSGKEAALLVPTGASANLLALMAHTCRGDGLIAERSHHVVRSEHASLAYVCGLLLRTLDGRGGHLDPVALEALLDERPAGREQPARLLWLESTHGAAGGIAVGPEEIDALAATARRRGLAVHVDGARALHTCAALGVSLAQLTRSADSLMLNLNKGLGAPAGAVLCASADTIAAAREGLGRLGLASLHQAGILAAAGLLALDEAHRLGDDHATARLLADRLAAVHGVRVDPAQVETNIVLVESTGRTPAGPALVAALAEHGVGVYPHTDRCVRLVTHRHVTAADVDAVVAAFAAVAAP